MGKYILLFSLLLFSLSGFSQVSRPQYKANIDTTIYTNGTHKITAVNDNALRKQEADSYWNTITDGVPIKTLVNGSGISVTGSAPTLTVTATGGSAWGLGGNSGTTSANFLGTTDNKTLQIKTNNVFHFDFDSLGRALIYGSPTYTNTPSATGLLLGGNSTQSYVQALSPGRGDLILNGKGNLVGIGLGTPKATFHVKYQGLTQDSGYIFRFDNASSVNLLNLSSTGTLTLNGPIKINSGSPGTGKVLTGTDAFGNATWQTPSGGSTTITGTSPIIVTGSNVSITTAMADGSTKGAASFVANDFDAIAGNIGIDYTNGQSASGSTKGFLTSTDWNTFNGKQNSLTFISPLALGSNTVTLGNVPVTNLNSGTSASSSTFWRGDGTWSAPPGSSYFAGNGMTLNTNTFSLTAPVSLANGGINSTLAAGASGTILRSNGSAYVPTTATYPATTTANQILYSTGTNAIGGSSSLIFDGTNLGIGKTTPTEFFDQEFTDATGGKVGLHIKNLSTSTSASYAGIGFDAQNGTVSGGLFVSPTSGIFSGGGIVFRTVTNHSMGFSTNNTVRMTLSNTGNLLVGGTTLGSEVLDVLGNIRCTGVVKLPGSSSGTLTIATPSVITTYTLTAPAADGTNGQFIKTNGAGVLSFGTVSETYTGTVTSVNAGTNLSLTAGTNSVNPTLSLAPTPTFVATNLTGLPLTTGVTGVLPVANGGTGTSTAFSTGDIVFSGVGGVYTHNASSLFEWDDSNKYLSIGTVSPSANLHIVNSNTTSTTYSFKAHGGNSIMYLRDNGTLELGDNATNSNLLVGFSAGLNKTTAVHNTALGHYSQQLITGGSNNVSIGENSLHSNLTGNGLVAIGYNAGFYAKNSDSLYINNRLWSTSAIERANSLVLGKFSSSGPSGQSIQINGSFGMNAIPTAGGGMVVNGFGGDASSYAWTTANSTGTPFLQARNDKVVEIVEGHLLTTQATAPTCSVTSSGTGLTGASCTSGSTDIAGQIQTTVSGGLIGNQSVVVTFNHAYSSAPKAVMISAANGPGGSQVSNGSPFVDTITTTSFTLNFGGTSGPPYFYYTIIQ